MPPAAGVTYFVEPSVMLGDVPTEGDPEIHAPFLANQILLFFIAILIMSPLDVHDVRPVVVDP